MSSTLCCPEPQTFWRDEFTEYYDDKYNLEDIWAEYDESEDGCNYGFDDDCWWEDFSEPIYEDRYDD